MADQRFLPNDGLMRHTLWCGMGLSENAGQRSWRHPASSLLLLLLLARLPIKRIPERATGPSSSRQLCCWELSLAAGGGNARSCPSCRPAQLARLGHGEPQLKSHYAEGGRHLGPLQLARLPNEACLTLTQLVPDVSPQLQLKRLQSSGFLPLNSPTD